VSRCGAAKSLFLRPKMERESLSSENYVNGFQIQFQIQFLDSLNTRFWSRWSGHGKSYFKKLDLLRLISFWLLPRVHLTCESMLNGKHFEKKKLYCKVLWMSLFELLATFRPLPFNNSRNWNLVLRKSSFWIPASI